MRDEAEYQRLNEEHRLRCNAETMRVRKPPSEPPTRLCCGQAHFGVVCLDKRVMCDHCFGRFEMQDLHAEPDGTYVNVCEACYLKEQAEITRRAEQEQSLLASLPHNGNPGED